MARWSRRVSLATREKRDTLVTPFDRYILGAVKGFVAGFSCEWVLVLLRELRWTDGRPLAISTICLCEACERTGEWVIDAFCRGACESAAFV